MTHQNTKSLDVEALRRRLVRAGLPSYAVQDCVGIHGEECLSVDFRDLPKQGSNKTLDAEIKAIGFDISDKGLIFGMGR